MDRLYAGFRPMAVPCGESMSSAKTIFSAGRLSLASLNFQADPALIQSWVPSGFNPELHNGDCYASLVCVSLKNVGGRGLPFPICFRLGAIYLRVYVSQETSHGTLRGFRQVRSAVTSERGRWLLRPLFGDDLKVMRIHQTLTGFDGTASEENPPSAEFSWKTGPEKSISKIKVTGRQRMTLGRRDSKVGFILDHSWLFAEHEGKTVAYEYKNAPATIWNAGQVIVQGDTSELLGTKLAKVLGRKPASVFLVEPSVITCSGPYTPEEAAQLQAKKPRNAGAAN